MSKFKASKFNQQDVEILNRCLAYAGYFRIDAYQLRHKRFDGGWSEARDFELFERGHSVAVLPYDPQTDQVVLIEQFRMGAIASDSAWLLEIIAGMVEDGESHEDTVRREAVEEACCDLTTLESISNVYVSPGGSSETCQIYCGKVDISTIKHDYAGLADEGEDIRIHITSYDEAIAALNTGKICSAPAMIGLQWLQLNRARLRQQWGP
ncbi:MAG: NUDIX domain-containing protein [Gammaproteobacteria bacterium]|nr:NUDIX domain-containing protein [Gammaproteobacteria bacterium]